MAPRLIFKTERQRKIMAILMQAFDNGEEICVAELHKRLAENIVYGTVRSALRHLVRHGMVYYTSPNGRENYYKPTSKGYAFFRPVT